MKNKKEKIGAILIGIAMMIMFGAVAVTADSSEVVVTWIVPGDTSFSLTFAGAETEIVFNCGDRNFSEIAARSQTMTLPILNVTNTGNTALDIHMIFNVSFATGIDFVNLSVDDATNTTVYWWEGASGADNASTSNETVASAIAIGDGEDFWFWSTGTNVEETAEGENLIALKVTSVGV